MAKVMPKKDYLEILPNHLKLRNWRAQKSGVPMPAKNEPLNEQESKIFEIIHLELIKKSSLPPNEAEKLIDSCINIFGKKDILFFFLEKPAMSKMTPIWLVYFVLAGVVYVFSPSYMDWIWKWLFALVGLILYLAGSIYYRRIGKNLLVTRESRRQEKIDKILTEGIKI